MSKKSRIIEVNILAEQRYLSKKFINEDETPQPVTQVNLPQTTQTTEDIKNMGVNVTDTTTQQSILQQLEPYKDKVDLDLLRKNVGSQNFFDQLSKYVKLQPKSVSNYGATIKVGNLTLSGNFNVKDKEVGNIGATYNTNVGKTPTSLMVKVNNPTSIGKSNFDTQNVQAGVKVNIPHSTNKYKGNML